MSFSPLYNVLVNPTSYLSHYDADVDMGVTHYKTMQIPRTNANMQKLKSSKETGICLNIEFQMCDFRYYSPL